MKTDWAIPDRSPVAQRLLVRSRWLTAHSDLTPQWRDGFSAGFNLSRVPPTKSSARRRSLPPASHGQSRRGARLWCRSAETRFCNKPVRINIMKEKQNEHLDWADGRCFTCRGGWSTGCYVRRTSEGNGGAQQRRATGQRARPLGLWQLPRQGGPSGGARERNGCHLRGRRHSNLRDGWHDGGGKNEQARSAYGLRHKGRPDASPEQG